MMFWRKKQEPMLHRDVQAEAARGISNAASVLPPKRFMSFVYYAILENRQVTVDDIDELANRLSRAAWERGRR
jgi:hypothetical protein